MYDSHMLRQASRASLHLRGLASSISYHGSWGSPEGHCIPTAWQSEPSAQHRAPNPGDDRIIFAVEVPKDAAWNQMPVTDSGSRLCASLPTLVFFPKL
jgi:hypothetical protein